MDFIHDPKDRPSKYFVVKRNGDHFKPYEIDNYWYLVFVVSGMCLRIFTNYFGVR